jgi:hypothetical protein
MSITVDQNQNVPWHCQTEQSRQITSEGLLNDFVLRLFDYNKRKHFEGITLTIYYIFTVVAL